MFALIEQFVGKHNQKSPTVISVLLAMRLRWDMIKDMKTDGEIVADGSTIYKNGKWLA